MLLLSNLETTGAQAAAPTAPLDSGEANLLAEVSGQAGGQEQVVQADQAAMTQYYSPQSFAYLDPGETYSFRLKNGTRKSLRLTSVREFKDSVIGLPRRAEVRVEIDGQPLDLVCAPYVMPTECPACGAETSFEWEAVGSVTVREE